MWASGQQARNGGRRLRRLGREWMTCARRGARVAHREHYLEQLVRDAHRTWPGNRTLTIACHGHSVPAGYFPTPHVDTFAAYPHLWHVRL